MVRRLIPLVVLAAAVLLPAAPAHAEARVSIANPSGQAKIDPTYATTLRVSGSGFQSIRGGHGGIYVFFGTVKSGWRPSKGGSTGADYFYVPDSESRDNQGFQRFVAFPGSDTASSANGGTIAANGSWSTQIVVPGATFQTYDRDGDVHNVDCRKVACGIITIGAHGVVNAQNETFTPVTVGSLGDGGGGTPSPSATPTGSAGEAPTADSAADPGADPSAAPTTGPAGKPQPAGPVTLEVDRGAAVAGNVLAFRATGLPAGAQVSAVFDDGAAGAGPFAAGTDGSLVGVLTLPPDTGPGTHELRLYGVDEPPSVSFAVQTADVVDTAAEVTNDPDDERAAWLFAGTAALLLVVALVRLVVRTRRSRRAAA